jgi:hypothetical protein
MSIVTVRTKQGKEKMATKKQAHALAEKLGGIIEDDGWALQLLAPVNHVSGATGNHTACYPLEDTTRAEGWNWIYQDLKSYSFILCEGYCEALDVKEYHE